MSFDILDEREKQRAELRSKIENYIRLCDPEELKIIASLSEQLAKQYSQTYHDLMVEKSDRDLYHLLP